MAEIGGTVTDSNGNGISRKIRAYRRDDGSFLGETISNPSSGVWSIDVAYSSGEVQVVMLDDAAGAVENDQILRTTPV